jgi:hypothetical protein
VPGARYMVTDLNKPMLDHPPAFRSLTTGSTGGWRMRRTCPSTTAPMKSSSDSSARCSFRTGRRVTRKRGACRADFSAT